MPEARHKKAMSEGWITSKQYAKLPPALLDGIIKSKKKSGTKTKEWSEKKGNKSKTANMPGARLDFDDTKQEKKKMKKKKK